MVTVDSIVAALASDPIDDNVSYRVLLSPDAVHVAIDPQGRPALLVPVSQLPEARSYVRGSLRLGVESRLQYSIGEAIRESPTIVVTCLDRDRPQSFSVFLLDLMHRLRVSDTGALAVIAAAMKEWHELLAKRERLSPEQERGLWGELALLERLPDCDRGLLAWCGPHGESVDFRGGGVAIECKTSSTQGVHSLSWRQGKRAQVAHDDSYLISLWIGETEATGCSLPEMIDAIEARVKDKNKFRESLLRVGYTFEHSERYTERYRLLGDPLMYRMDDVPGLHGVDAGVSRVSYTVSLDSVQPVDVEALRRTLEQLVERNENDTGQ